MAKRRKVSNVLGLAVLSTVVLQPMHPYEMASALRRYGKDQDMKIKWGSLYTVVQNLEKHGFLAVAESVRLGGRPERTVYRITDAGRAELADWIRELLAEPEREYPRFKAGLSVAGILSPNEVTQLLQQRITSLDEQIAEQRALLATSADVPRIFLIEAEYDLAIRQAEASWVRSLLTELTDGSLPGMDLWQAFHDTGQMPPELTDIAERDPTTD